MKLLPARKLWRRLIAVVIVLAFMAVLWFRVFPWVDRTYVNRPAIERGLGLVAASVTHL